MSSTRNIGEARAVGRGKKPFLRTSALLCLSVLMLLSFNRSVLAQAPLGDLIFTVGTTTRDTSANDWAYITIGAPSSGLLAGKRLAVFGKIGDAASGNNFSQRGTMMRQNDAGAINTLLNQSAALGQNLALLNDSLNLLLRRVPGITNQTLPNKVLIALQSAQTDAQIALRLEMMAKANPGLSLCLGQAFAEQITAITTYELREVHPLTGAVGDVIGRATISPGSPIVLPAPGKPFHVTTEQASDDLLIRLRWGTPDPLRRLLLAGYGFNIWRIGYTEAIAGNFHKVPPMVAQLYSNPSFVRVNDAAVQAPLLTPAAASDATDTQTYFFADDNRRSQGAAPFVDGQRFYYFITARDVLGRDGLVSAGEDGRACRRKPPQAPTALAVRDEPLTDASSNVLQRFRVAWAPNANTNDVVTHYWVYRWPNPSMALTNAPTELTHRIGIVPQVTGTNVISLLDTNVNSPTNPGPSVYWYTVRSAFQGVCGPVVSAHSAPQSGVLRERSGPEAATGGVLGSCGTPVVAFSNFTRVAVSNLDTSRWHYLFSCERRDPAIAWVQFFTTNAQHGVETIGPIYFAPDENRLEVDYSVATNVAVLFVSCIVGTTYDLVSRPATYNITTPNVVGQRANVSYFAGTVLLTAPSGSDPLMPFVNGGLGNSCTFASNVRIDPSGTVTMQLNVSPPGPVLLQGSTNGVNWFDIGMAFPETNGLYSISYAACLTGPVPQFRGCAVTLPGDGDCVDHLPRAADNGPVAPMVVHFTPPPRTREYRIYRQADDGPMTLMSQGRTSYDPLRALRRIVVHDDVMPSVSTRLCYFVQVFDENGNPSPMAALGCREVQPPAPPRPVLAEPAPAGTVAQPQVTLNWFCPTAGVHRFRFLIKRVDKKPEAPPPGTSSSIGFVSALLTRSQPVRQIGGYLRTPLRSTRFSMAVVSVDEGQLTPTLSSGFGPGPQFTLTADILPNVPYQITVQALNSRDQAGPISEMWEFTWRPPNVTPGVPWPARALPPVEAFDTAPVVPDPGYNPRVTAVLFTNVYRQLDDTEYPIGIRIGELNPNLVLAYQHNIGTNRFAAYAVGLLSAYADPNASIFRRASANPTRRGESLLPFAMYRQQITNSAFPRVSGDLVQVSPLIDRIPWKEDADRAFKIITIPDCLFAIRDEQANQVFHGTIYLRDQQPVVRGARYRYFLVRFLPNGEVDQIIQAGEVEASYVFGAACIDC